MAEAYSGLKVFVLLHSGIKLDGIVSQVFPSSHQMTLKDVTLHIPGQLPHFTPIYGVIGKDIKDLQVLAPTTPNVQQTLPIDNHILDQIPSSHPPTKTVTTIKSTSKTRKTKQQTNNCRKKNGWAGEDVNIFREEEFDFQKNLDMFDKAKVFAEISESDETAPEDLLVTLNRLPQKNQTHLLPTENVLGVERVPLYDMTTTRHNNKSKDKKRQSVKIVTAQNGNIQCSAMTPLQMTQVEHECDKKIIQMNQKSCFEDVVMENGGRGAALLVLQILNRMNIVSSPSIVIMVGQHDKKGCVGLVAARHLINHGCHVTVCIESGITSDATLQYEIAARRYGARVCHHIQELGDSYDLVMDAIVEIEEMSHSIYDMIDWVNDQSKPVLSIDFPSGVDATTGIPYQPEYVIHPNWTLCLGAPKTGCKSHEITGDLYLVDIGIPRLCWKHISVKGNMVPWGADFLIALEYDK
ncbi:YjeF N-terminal domain-containing protein [Cokeromyces recurvatus]|uniref:YjeF N-terminal domain-containing protein n=1 Tax=Cokeromyces recurvatus TaxID=90255 RepID=UPI00221FE661|nr:YjeF N-terminal domain-containing protein [Cokeromyces recurvatus]KAI7899238.1 YjeF N-terminal domain-containing protein [Cokeromyces recurvatus]